MDEGKLRQVILAFLAGRSPAAYRADTITERIKRSGHLDNDPSSVDIERELRIMAHPRFKWVDLAVEESSQEVVWYATEQGIRRWTLDGSMCVRC